MILTPIIVDSYTFNTDSIIADSLSELGYISAENLTTSWDKSNNTLNYSLTTTVNTSVTLIDYIVSVETNMSLIAQSQLQALGYANIEGLETNWDSSANTYTANFNTASFQSSTINNGIVESISNSNGDIVSFVTKYPQAVELDMLSKADVSELVPIVLEELGVRNVEGLSSIWNIDANILDISVSSSTFKDNSAKDIQVHIEMNSVGDLIKAVVEGEIKLGKLTIGKITIDPSELSFARKQVIKQAYLAADANENLKSINSNNDAALITLQALGYEQISGLSASWDGEELTATINFTSAKLNGEIINNATITTSIDYNGVIDLYSNVGMIDGTNYSYDHGNLDGTEEFIVEVGNYAMAEINGGLQIVSKDYDDLNGLEIDAVQATHDNLNEIDRIISNQNFTDVSASIVFDGSGNIINYNGSMEHEYVGIIATTSSDLSASEKSIMQDMYNEITTPVKTQSAAQLTNNISFDLYKDGNDTGDDLIIDQGVSDFSKSVDFDNLKVTDTQSYTQDVNISDAISVLRHIVDLEPLSTRSAGFNAADVNNDGKVNISDAIGILRHIVGLDSIDTFDLVDNNGKIINHVDADVVAQTSEIMIVANGDVNMSGEYESDYITMADVL